MAQHRRLVRRELGELFDALFEGLAVEASSEPVHLEPEVALPEIHGDFAFEDHVGVLGVVSEAFEMEIVGAVDGVHELRVDPVREDEEHVVQGEDAQSAEQEDQETGRVLEAAGQDHLSSSDTKDAKATRTPTKCESMTMLFLMNFWRLLLR